MLRTDASIPCMERRAVPFLEARPPMSKMLLTVDQWLILLEQMPKEYEAREWGAELVTKPCGDYFEIPITLYFSMLLIIDQHHSRRRG